jgi:hypothetical protein
VECTLGCELRVQCQTTAEGTLMASQLGFVGDVGVGLQQR